MSERINENPRVFLEQKIDNLDLGLKKLLLLDYLIYYDENQPNEQEIKSLSSGIIPIELKTKNTINNGSIALFPRDYSLQRNYNFLPLPKTSELDSDYEYEEISEERDISMENYENNHYEDDEEFDNEDPCYNQMMKEINKDIQKEIIQDIISDRNNMIDNPDLFLKERNNYLHKSMKKSGVEEEEDDEWEDIDQIDKLEREEEVEENKDEGLIKNYDEDDFEEEEENEEYFVFNSKQKKRGTFNSSFKKKKI